MLTALVPLGRSFRVFDRAWFTVQERRHASAWKERPIWLSGYRMRIEAQPIGGLNDSVFVLTFDPDRRTLFTVTDQPVQTIKLSLQGKALQAIPLTGFDDAEAIEYISRSIYVIIDERQQHLIKVYLEDDTRFIDAADAQQLSLGIGLNGNRGSEGLAYDVEDKCLFVAKKRGPVHIYEVHGFPRTQADKPLAVHVVDDPGRDKRLFVRDLSNLQPDEGTEHLLALSDESCLVAELDTDGESAGTLSLLRGMHGLKRGTPQAEGVATDDHGALYLVNKPNLFYIFNKDELAQL